MSFPAPEGSPESVSRGRLRISCCKGLGMSSAVFLLPLAVWALLVLLVPGSLGLAPAAIRATLLFGGIAFVLTEGLSLGQALRPLPVGVAWALVCAALAGLAVVRRGTGRLDPLWWRRRYARWHEDYPGATNCSVVVMVAVMAVVVLLTGIIAVASPPNNWDSLTYHLPRVMHWAANGNVNHYRTAIDPQLYNGPFKEYLLLHLYLLTGSQATFNLVQWCAMLVAALACYLIAGELGACPPGQIAAAFVAMTTPMAILQATSTQSDLTETAAVLLLVHTVLVDRRAPPGDLGSAALVGLAVGLVTLTKSTGFIFALPIMALWLAGRRAPVRRVISALGLVILFFLAINGPSFARNLTSWRSPLGPPSSSDMVNDHFGAGLTILNAARLAGSELTTPSTRVNQQIVTWVNGLGDVLGIPPTAEASLLGGTPYDLPWKLHEDLASGPIQALLVATVLMAVLFRRRLMRGLPTAYAAAVLVGFTLFAAYLRWQVWGNRLDLPLLLMWAPLVGLLMGSWRRWVVVALGLCITIWAVPFLVANQSRPLLGPDSVLTVPRETMLFRNRPSVRDSYRSAADLIMVRHPTTVGLVMGKNSSWEYPLWSLTGGPLRGPRFVAVLPEDITPSLSPAYQALVCVDMPSAICGTFAPPGWTITPLHHDVTIALPQPVRGLRATARSQPPPGPAGHRL